MSQNTFKRLEIKYLISKDQYECLQKMISPYMQADEYGLSRISSIYFDTDNYDLIRESLEKPVYKEKLRMRAYGTVTKESNVFVELKKKYEGVVYKRRVKMSLSEAEAFLFEGIYPKEDSQILREIKYFLDFHKPERTTFISYDRLAMYGKTDSNLRITFDSNLRAAFDRRDIVSGKEGRPILTEDTYLMEIKAAGCMPLWLTGVLSDLKIYPASFSKYGRACKDFMDYGKCEFVPQNCRTEVKENGKVMLCIKKFA